MEKFPGLFSKTQQLNAPFICDALAAEFYWAKLCWEICLDSYIYLFSYLLYLQYNYISQGFRSAQLKSEHITTQQIDLIK